MERMQNWREKYWVIDFGVPGWTIVRLHYRLALHQPSMAGGFPGRLEIIKWTIHSIGQAPSKAVNNRSPRFSPPCSAYTP